MTAKYFRLSYQDRIRIEKYLSDGKKPYHISIKLGVNRSSISREISRNKDSEGNYRAIYSQKKTKSRARCRKLGKRRLLLNKTLKDYVNSKLQLTWSPNQIAKTLKLEFKNEVNY